MRECNSLTERHSGDSKAFFDAQKNRLGMGSCKTVIKHTWLGRLACALALAMVLTLLSPGAGFFVPLDAKASPAPTIQERADAVVDLIGSKIFKKDIPNFPEGNVIWDWTDTEVTIDSSTKPVNEWLSDYMIPIGQVDTENYIPTNYIQIKSGDTVISTIDNTKLNACSVYLSSANDTQRAKIESPYVVNIDGYYYALSLMLSMELAEYGDITILGSYSLDEPFSVIATVEGTAKSPANPQVGVGLNELDFAAFNPEGNDYVAVANEGLTAHDGTGADVTGTKGKAVMGVVTDSDVVLTKMDYRHVNTTPGTVSYSFSYSIGGEYDIAGKGVNGVYSYEDNQFYGQKATNTRLGKGYTAFIIYGVATSTKPKSVPATDDGNKTIISVRGIGGSTYKPYTASSVFVADSVFNSTNTTAAPITVTYGENSDDTETVRYFGDFTRAYNTMTVGDTITVNCGDFTLPDLSDDPSKFWIVSSDTTRTPVTEGVVGTTYMLTSPMLEDYLSDAVEVTATETSYTDKHTVMRPILGEPVDIDTFNQTSITDEGKLFKLTVPAKKYVPLQFRNAEKSYIYPADGLDKIPLIESPNGVIHCTNDSDSEKVFYIWVTGYTDSVDAVTSVNNNHEIYYGDIPTSAYNSRKAAVLASAGSQINISDETITVDWNVWYDFAKTIHVIKGSTNYDTMYCSQYRYDSRPLYKIVIPAHKTYEIKPYTANWYATQGREAGFVYDATGDTGFTHYYTEIGDAVNSEHTHPDLYVKAGFKASDMAKSGWNAALSNSSDGILIENTEDEAATWFLEPDYKTFYLKEYSATPTASFAADGTDSGTLSDVTSGMQYSIDGGNTWTDISDTTVSIASGVTTTNGIKVKTPATATTTESAIQTIEITQAEAPAGLEVTACTTSSNDDGTITGLDSSKLYEYKLSSASDYTSVGASATSITGLAAGTYVVRVKASGTVLASSDSVEAVVKEYTATPDATFVADGTESGTLSDVTSGMQYSIDGGSTWTDITETTVTITSGVTAANDIKVKTPGTETATESEVQTIDITQAEAPTGLSVTACTTSSDNDGTITGLTSSVKYQYKLSGATSYTDVADNAESITALVPGTYYVRVKASGTVLASSDSAAIVVKAYTATPTATFVADSANSGTLSDVANGMKYSLDGGENWVDITGTTVTITSGVVATNDIKVKTPGTATTAESAIQTIDVTQADKPTGLSKTDCTLSTNDNGTITGLTASKEYEYRLSTVTTYTSVAESSTTISGLSNGTYYVREKASGTKLASADSDAFVIAAAPKVETPVLPAAGSFSSSKTITITCGTAGATIYYTTNGSAPTTASTAYTDSFTVSSTTTVKAIAVKDGMTDSEIATATYTYSAPGHTHSYTSTVTKEPTCTETGVRTYRCSGCTSSYTETIPAKGHTLTAHTAKEATCGEEGNKAYWECSVCKKLFADKDGKTETTEAAVKIAKTDKHTLTAHESVAATCEKEGKKAYWECSVCKKLFSDKDGKTETTETALVEKAKGHNLTAHAEVKATCTEDGKKAYWECSECKKLFADAEGKTETTEAELVVKTEGHKLTHVEAVEATTEKDGNIEYWTCSVCGKYFADAEGKSEITKEQTVLPKSEHKLALVPEKKATCTEDGNKAYYTCSHCDKLFEDAEGKKEITLAETVIKYEGHKLTHVEAKDPTVDEEGNIEYWTCSECGKLFKDSEGKEEITEEETKIEKLIDIAEATVTGLGNKAWTGSEIKPTVTVKHDGKTLKKGTDYTVSYSNNTNAGNATVKITGKGKYGGTVKKTFAIKKVTLKYRAYVQKKNWMAWSTAGIGTKVNEAKFAGTTDNLRMETIQMQLSGIGGSVKYRAYVEKMGWTQWATTADKSTFAGTKGMSRRVEMIQLKAAGQVANLYDMYYRTYCEKFGWLGWAGNNEKSGSAGYARKLEAFQVQFVPKGTKFNQGTTKAFYDIAKDGMQ
ncbi:MAG: chitobiase/beta-hexosaminidase C-terminal domain-containing protein [Lachnospiraceae bacterium]|nr:chitobiase/beta-hexosaminidase C-terminal domain-containing protein [Lachnospiraceae bacterium]